MSFLPTARHVLVLAGALAAAIALPSGLGCQVLLDIESRTADPIAPGCALPQGGPNRIRLANLLPARDGVDVCIKASGAEAYGRPVFRDGGIECPSGALFKQVTSVFTAPAGRVDVRVLPAGTTTCDGAPPIAEGTIDLAPGATTTTLTILGGGGEAPRVAAISERPDGAVGGRGLLRFVNAVGGVGPLLFGVTNSDRLPTTMAYYVKPEGVPFGGVLPQGPTASGAVDEQGYLQLEATATLPYGASLQASNEALLVTKLTSSAVSTLFAVGDPVDRLFPIRALVCADATSDEPFVRCSESDPPSLSLDVFAAGFYGLFAPIEAARRTAVPGAVAARTSDIMCLTEVNRKEDRQAIIDAAKESFPFAYQVDSDLETPFSDPTDLNGNTPTPPNTPPCAGSEEALAAALQCGRERCSTVPDGSGIANDGDCISSQCVAALSGMVLSTDPATRRCYNCATSGILSGETWDTISTTCRTNAKADYVFRGQTPSLILSKYPLTRTEAHQLPATSFRRAVLAATLELEAGVELDYYCAHFSVEQSQAYPYTGLYGEYSAGDSAQGWHQEQALQVKQLIDFVKRRSGDRRAIIAGDFETSLAVPESNIVDRNPAVVERLRSNFQLAVPATYTPICTTCEPTRNPYNSGSAGFWEHAVYLHNFGPDASVSAGLFFTDPAVTSGSITGPLSPSFGFNTRILRR